jgi:hypothetical protein
MWRVCTGVAALLITKLSAFSKKEKYKQQSACLPTPSAHFCTGFPGIVEKIHLFVNILYRASKKQ